MDANKVHGLVLHDAAIYDFTVWLFTLGRERGFRERILKLAQLRPGESVLDVGCGTGGLAIEAKRQVGPGGTVRAIDPSAEMIARATRKARKAGLDVEFANAPAQELPFADAEVDIVLSTLMFHHLGRRARAECAQEMKRVLKPGGRVLVVDFEKSTRERKGLFAHMHRHGGVNRHEVASVLEGAGLKVVESGALGFRGLEFCLAR